MPAIESLSPADRAAPVLPRAAAPRAIANGPSKAANKGPAEPRTLAEQIYADAPGFDFFQSVRVLERLPGAGEAVGFDASPSEEAVRFRSHLSLNFPASAIHDIQPPRGERTTPLMAVTFFGLVGPSGVLPRHYTELLLRHERDTKHLEKRALRDWFDLFTHRFLSLFYRAWSKYRYFVPYERELFDRDEPDPFTHALLSFAGLGSAGLRNRLKISTENLADPDGDPQVLARVDDLALLHYTGMLARRARTAAGLEAMLADYFEIPVQVQQFHGQWLALEPSDQSQLGQMNCGLGSDCVIGDRVWDVEGTIRIRLGPLNYEQFAELVPDIAPIRARKAFFILSHMVRLYVGPTLEFDVQAVLAPEAVPPCQLASDAQPGPCLGWNTWIRSTPAEEPVGDAVFAGREVFWLNQT